MIEDHKPTDQNKVASLDVQQMNRIMRHRLRNLCAGVKMTIDRIADMTAEVFPQIPNRCEIIRAEMDKLQVFTERMDLLFGSLPAPERITLIELISNLKTDFSRKFPFCSLNLTGEEENIVFDNGSWLLIALRELLNNAGEACAAEGQVAFGWSRKETFSFIIANTGVDFPKEIPLYPPQPFFTTRSRHDGFGLAIVERICQIISAEFKLAESQAESVVFTINIPSENLTHE